MVVEICQQRMNLLTVTKEHSTYKELDSAHIVDVRY